MRRTVIPWVIALGLVLAAGAATVLVLSATALGPGAFVRVYLDAVARGDAREALSLPGVDAPDDAADDLLTRGALPGLSDIRQVDDTTTDAGIRLITVEWTSAGVAGETTFAVERSGTRFGLFPEWRFAESPVAAVRLDVAGDLRYQVGSVEADTDAEGAPDDVAVLVPGTYEFEHETLFLEADPVAVAVDTPGTVAEARLEVRANERFMEAVDTEVRRYLDECTTQTVLQPTGCPFGYQESNRIESTPEWSMTEYPAIELQAGPQLATWQVVDAAAVAHLVVDVRSLFDGSLSTTDVDVPFGVSFQVEFVSDTELTIRPIG